MEVLERKQKSRTISIYQFFEILQIEWVIADLRLRLYPRKKDKVYWQKIRDFKRSKIENIAEKNSLPTIFSDEDMKADFLKKVFRENSYPNFHYKDESNRLEQECYDLINYYAKDADVRCRIYDEIKIGKVISFNPHTKNVLVKLADSGTEEKIKIDFVTRIL